MGENNSAKSVTGATRSAPAAKRVEDEYKQLVGEPETQDDTNESEEKAELPEGTPKDKTMMLSKHDRQRLLQAAPIGGRLAEKHKDEPEAIEYLAIANQAPPLFGTDTSESPVASDPVEPPQPQPIRPRSRSGDRQTTSDATMGAKNAGRHAGGSRKECCAKSRPGRRLHGRHLLIRQLYFAKCDVWKALSIFSVEDIGVADLTVKTHVLELMQLAQKCADERHSDLLHVVTAMLICCRAKKSRAADDAILWFNENPTHTMPTPDEIQAAMENTVQPPIPDKVFDIHTTRGAGCKEDSNTSRPRRPF